MKLNNRNQNRIQPSVFITTLLLIVVIFVLFNFNSNIFDARAQISGGGNPGYLARCLPSGSTSPVVGGGNVGYLVKWVSPSGSPPSVAGGCSNSQYLAKWATQTLTLTASFTATPATIYTGDSTNLQTVVGGSATGTINYSIWWDCPAYNNPLGTDPNPTFGEAVTACGGAPAINCTDFSGALGHKCDANADPNPPAYSAPHTYTSAGSRRPIVIVERGGVSAMGVAPVTVNTPPQPSVANPTVRVFNSRYCGSGVHATVEGTYTDPGGVSGDAYEILIDDDLVSNPNTSLGSMNPEWESGTIAATIVSGTAFSHDTSSPCNPANSDTRPQLLCQMTFNNPPGTGVYTAWARARSSVGGSNWSQWERMSYYSNSGGPLVAQINWSTPPHSFPDPDFSSSPVIPTVNSPVTFTESPGTFSPDSPSANWSWNFGDGSAVQNQSDPTPPLGPTSIDHVYSNTGTYQVTFTAQDDAGTCSVTYPLILEEAIPRWIEVAPR